MLKAMLTGATGFVGGALLRELLARGWGVRVLVRPQSDPRNLNGHDHRCERVPGDLRDPASIRRAMAGCDTVFHVAARYSLWNPRPREIYQDNVDGTRNVLAAASDLSVRKVVYTSTVGVLKLPAGGRPADESSLAEVADLAGHYKRSKWYAEECARSFAARGLPVVIVNPSTPIGPHDLKPTPTGKIIVDFLRGRMFAYTDTGLNLVAVEDVAAGHLLAAERGRPGERYILGGENVSLKGFLDVLSGITGRRAPRLAIPPKALLPMSLVAETLSRFTRRPPFIPWEAARMAQKHMYFESERARRELGYSSSPVTAALERAVRWFQDNGHVSSCRRPHRNVS